MGTGMPQFSVFKLHDLYKEKGTDLLRDDVHLCAGKNGVGESSGIHGANLGSPLLVGTVLHEIGGLEFILHAWLHPIRFNGQSNSQNHIFLFSFFSLFSPPFSHVSLLCLFVSPLSPLSPLVPPPLWVAPPPLGSSHPLPSESLHPAPRWVPLPGSSPCEDGGNVKRLLLHWVL